MLASASASRLARWSEAATSSRSSSGSAACRFRAALAVALDEPDDLLVVPDVVHGEAHRHDTVDVRQDEEAEREHLLEDRLRARERQPEHRGGVAVPLSSIASLSASRSTASRSNSAYAVTTATLMR